MKIIIDTREDSSEDIKNAIKMLSLLIGEKLNASQPNVFENSSLEVGQQENIFGDIFDEKTTSDEQKAAEETEENTEGAEEAAGEYAEEAKEETKTEYKEIKEKTPPVMEYY